MIMQECKPVFKTQGGYAMYQYEVCVKTACTIIYRHPNILAASLILIKMKHNFRMLEFYVPSVYIRGGGENCSNSPLSQSQDISE